MVLNGLGFVQQALYLTPQFFKARPTERLIGEGIRPEHLNDDTLGRALDSLYDYGVTELFRDLAAHGAAQLGLASRFAHLDATSFLAHGEYNSERETEDGVVQIRKGYSRDHRPDLNQVVLNLMVEHKAGLPMLMEPLSGNASDQGSFPELIDQHIDHLQNAHGFDYVVADSSLYSASHVEDLDRNGVKFITRVPLAISEAEEVVQETDPAALEPLTEGYEAREHISEYGGVRQRWLVVHSEAAEARAKESAANRRDREHKEEKREFRELLAREFSCREDAKKALSAFEEDLTASTLAEGRVLRAICFTMDEEGTPVETGEESYLLQGKLVPSEARKAELVKRKSFFILATNELDEERLSGRELLKGYKGQSKVERGFRFMKDPWFVASSLFLESEERIEALLMVMTLCLMVYAALQHRIRQGLQAGERSYPDQKGKPTQRPTARWIFQSFEGIHVLHVGSQHLVLNMEEHHRTVVSILGPGYERLYVSHPT
ncbi:MAG: IS1634 family transposase [Salinibacter sp.]|uniref:IS1634 family transposase n=1 Tax=Salinibacter sp. TaxID=2065818 RepID=UPI0035D4D292